ncbi:signal peptidase I [Actinomycetes bacterium]|nr:signal peptidase I [Actinomycetes bacterium]
MSSAVEPTAKTGMGAIREWITVIGVALLIAFVVRGFVLQQFYISGPSMESTMFQNNRVLVNKLSYRLHDIHRGDVVVFDRVTTDGVEVQHDDLIKRVIGVAGDTVSISNCVVSVNGSEVDEPYLNDYDLAQTNLEDRCRVPEMVSTIVEPGHLFVMGDNRPQSFDSRMFGTIEEDLVVGRAFVIIWPLGSFDWL